MDNEVYSPRSYWQPSCNQEVVDTPQKAELEKIVSLVTAFICKVKPTLLPVDIPLICVNKFPCYLIQFQFHFLLFTMQKVPPETLLVPTLVGTLVQP